MVTKVGRWDCPYCKTKGNPGYEYTCSGCEHPRPLKIRFYLPENAPVATAEQKAMMGEDPNWYCEYCECGNKSDVERCWKCGAPRSGKSLVHPKRVYYNNAIPRTAEEAEAMEVSVEAEPMEPYLAPEDPYNPQDDEPQTIPAIPSYRDSTPIPNFEMPEKKLKPLAIAGVVLGVLAVIFAIYFFFLRTTERTATVSGFAWTQNVMIEEYQTHHKEGWSVPAGGRTTGSETRQSGTRKVEVGSHLETITDTCYDEVTVYVPCTQDNGNGGFDDGQCPEETEVPYVCETQVPVTDYQNIPVYSTWYFYDIDEWTVIGNYPTSGNDHEPYFDPMQPVGDLQRRTEQNGTYTVYFECDGLKPFEWTYDKATWLSFDYNQGHKIKVNALKMVLSVE